MYLLKISGQVDNKIHVFRPHAPHRGHGLAQSPCTRLLSSMIVLVLDGHNITFSNPFDIHSNKRSPNYNTFLSTKGMPKCQKIKLFVKQGPLKRPLWDYSMILLEPGVWLNCIIEMWRVARSCLLCFKLLCIVWYHNGVCQIWRVKHFA